MDGKLKQLSRLGRSGDAAFTVMCRYVRVSNVEAISPGERSRAAPELPFWECPVNHYLSGL
jgi:hypothetical protein